MPSDQSLYYRHGGAALLRAAVAAIDDGPAWWPDLDDARNCERWLRAAWALPGLADGVAQSSGALAGSIAALLSGRRPKRQREIRRACMSLIRYHLRAIGRPTPFGLFAGTVPAALGDSTVVRWGDDHRPMARVDLQWLADVIGQLESIPELLMRLDVQASNLTVRRGDRIETPFGPQRASVAYTKAVQALCEAAIEPVRVSTLMERMLADFPGGSPEGLHRLLIGLIRQGFVITNLRAPFTVTDPLSFLVERLNAVGATQVTSAEEIIGKLDAIHPSLRLHNRPGEGRRCQREEIMGWMGALSSAGRYPLAVDLVLDCGVQVPTHVAEEMERAASVMLRLSRRPAGDAAWRGYHTRFIERYGTGVLVPVTAVTDLDAGLGYPASYLGSVAPEPIEAPTRRDQVLLGMAMRALADGTGEVEVTEQLLADLTADNGFDDTHFPPHVELAARIQARTADALNAGDYRLVISPARSAGTLTCRFSVLSTGSGLDDVYRDLPVSVAGALPVQMSFPPAYPHAENVCRIPAFTTPLIRFGEHLPSGGPDAEIRLDDLAVLATHQRLYLVSITRQQIIEPQVLHALAMQKQPPPLVRFLAHLARGFGALWTEVDWGPHCHDLPFLPRLRCGRSIIAPARWHLAASALPSRSESTLAWSRALAQWQAMWRLPNVVELRDDDRTLRLDLTVAAHRALLRQHLNKPDSATFTEAPGTAEDFGWIGGRAHEIAIPMVTRRPPAPSPLREAPIPVITNRHGHTPGAPTSPWIQIKLFTHPERMDEVLTAHLPRLTAMIDGDPQTWFVRYRSPLELPHLRLRLHTPDLYHHASYTAAIGHWTQRLRDMGLISHTLIDSYQPEVGRYGVGPALDAAEQVFTADSAMSCALLRHRQTIGLAAPALSAVSMVCLVAGFLGDTTRAMRWLSDQPALTGPTLDRDILKPVLALTAPGRQWELPNCPPDVTDAHMAWARALSTYAEHATASVIDSLLHMHHNRLAGLDQADERTARRIARHAAVASLTRQGSR